jgi:hypothetical protein
MQSFHALATGGTGFEQSYPMSAPAVTGVVAVKGNPELNVDLTPVPVADGIARLGLTAGLRPAR